MSDGGRAARVSAWWRGCGAPLRLVVVNVVVSLAVIVAMLGLYYGVPGEAGVRASELPLRWVSLPGSVASVLLRPWSVVTYMFVQHDAMHLLVNMLWLYMFGGLFMLCGTGRQLTGLYLLGGLGGAVLFEGLSLLSPWATSGGLEGSSAAVVAVVTAVTVILSHMRVRLMLVGEVRVLWVGVVTLVLLAVGGMRAPGAEAAHLGGALVGFVYALMMRRGRDITAGVTRAGDMVVNMLRGVPSAWRGRRRGGGGGSASVRRDDVSDILEKVKRSGYASLTSEERARLFGRR